MIPEPLSPPRPYIPAVLPDVPSTRVVRRGDPENVLLSYYQTPPLDEESSLHVLDVSYDEPANRVPFTEAFAWPDEDGLLHFGTNPDPNLGYVRAFSSEAPSRFFDLTDRFNGEKSLAQALYLKAEITRPVQAGESFDPESVRIILEDGAEAPITYTLLHQSLGGGQYRVTVLSGESTYSGQAIWARYRTLENGSPLWVSEPLAFSSWFTDERLGLGGEMYTLSPAMGSTGYNVRVPEAAEDPYPNGTAFLWRVKGTLSGRPVVTGWFPDWVALEDGDKVLEDRSISSILTREHPGAIGAQLESVKLWGGSLTVKADGSSRPTASTDRSGVPQNLSDEEDRIRLPYQGRIFLNAYEEMDEADISWQVTARGTRLNANVNDGHGGKGNGTWEVRTNKGGYSTKNDWSYSSHIQLYYQKEPPNDFSVTVTTHVYVTRAGSFTLSVANDDDISIYVNDVLQYSRGSTRYWKWFNMYYDYYTATIRLSKGWNEIRMYLRDRGNNLLGTDYCSLDIKPALHVRLEQVWGNEFWIGSGTLPGVTNWTRTQSGTKHIAYGEDPLLISPSPYSWPDYDWYYADVQASGFQTLELVQMSSFRDDGKFTIQITGPSRVPVGGTRTIKFPIDIDLKELRLASFGEIEADLGLTDLSPSRALRTYIEVQADPREIAARFYDPKDPIITSDDRYHSSPDGSPRVLLRDLRNTSDGWLIVWTRIPRDRIAKRFAFRTKDRSRIFALPSGTRRTPQGVLPAWHVNVRPGRFSREEYVDPSLLSYDRYSQLSGFVGRRLAWVYDLPEYEALAFDPAPPYRRVTFDGIPVLSGDRLELPHQVLAINAGLEVKDAQVHWVASSTGEAKIVSRIASDSVEASYIAYEDAYPYRGYRQSDGTFIGLDLTPSRYHHFTAGTDGSIPGHMALADEPTMHPGTALLGRNLTLYVLPTQAVDVFFRKNLATKSEPFNSSTAITGGSSNVEVSSGSLRLISGKTSGTAILSPWSVPNPMRQVRIVSSSENMTQGDSITYQVWDGNAWTTLQKGQYLLLASEQTDISVRILISSPSGSATVNDLKLEAMGVEEVTSIVASWDNALFHTDATPQEVLAADPMAVPIAVVTVGIHASPDDVTLIDARRRGGGVSSDARTQLTDPSGYWDIGFWDGQAHLENGIIVVELPSTLLREYGGSFTHGQVMEQLRTHLNFGTLVVVRYKGADGSWITATGS